MYVWQILFFIASKTKPLKSFHPTTCKLTDVNDIKTEAHSHGSQLTLLSCSCCDGRRQEAQCRPPTSWPLHPRCTVSKYTEHHFWQYLNNHWQVVSVQLTKNRLSGDSWEVLYFNAELFCHPNSNLPVGWSAPRHKQISGWVLGLARKIYPNISLSPSLFFTGQRVWKNDFDISPSLLPVILNGSKSSELGLDFRLQSNLSVLLVLKRINISEV